MGDMLDRMVEGHFLWIVYDMESAEVVRILDGNIIHLCRSACALINFHIVEMHRPERCLRQIRMHQGIQPPATNFDNFHKLTRQGRNNCDWATYHKDFVEMWNDIYNFVIGGDYVIPGTPDIIVDYVGWYHRISQIFLSPPVVPSNMMATILLMQTTDNLSHAQLMCNLHRYGQKMSLNPNHHLQIWHTLLRPWFQVFHRMTLVTTLNLSLVLHNFYKVTFDRV
ncbi:serine/threonine-protein phosphatase 7 long form homolog [Primulina eburnea]|uniref:serine/threonine-protein phosphatase 7 long form homolog n=1 Tax=Primulina eburnea TaxID=1245227 RepID=UPI003C6BFA7B